LISDKTQEGF
jgi:peptide chain release factor subunit 1